MQSARPSTATGARCPGREPPEFCERRDLESGDHLTTPRFAHCRCRMAHASGRLGTKSARSHREVCQVEALPPLHGPDRHPEPGSVNALRASGSDRRVAAPDGQNLRPRVDAPRYPPKRTSGHPIGKNLSVRFVRDHEWVPVLTGRRCSNSRPRPGGPRRRCGSSRRQKEPRPTRFSRVYAGGRRSK